MTLQEKIARCVILPLFCLISGCVSPPPGVVSDARPDGNAGIGVRDISPDKWVFEKTADAMSANTGYSATIWSKNTVSLSYPFQGSQRLTLSVGRSPEGKAYAVIGVPRGQFDCYKCDVRIRFGKGEARIWSANAPGKLSGFLLISGEDNFIAQLRSSGRVMVELPFYDFGSVPVEFGASNFPW